LFLKNLNFRWNCHKDCPRITTIPTAMKATDTKLRVWWQRLELKSMVFIDFVFLCVGRNGKTCVTLGNPRESWKGRSSTGSSIIRKTAVLWCGSSQAGQLFWLFVFAHLWIRSFQRFSLGPTFI
jgi:hypothetical protein